MQMQSAPLRCVPSASLKLPCCSPPRLPALSPSLRLRLRLRASPASAPSSSSPPSDPEQALLLLLQQRRTEEAYSLFSRLPRLPGPACLSRLLAQLSFSSLPRAKALLSSLASARQLHLLDSHSLGLLASAAARAGHSHYAASLLRSMLKSRLLPHVKAWTAALSALAAHDASADALSLFRQVMQRITRHPDLHSHLANPNAHPSLLSNSLPDATAFNAALNACANLADVQSFSQIFLHDMPHFNVTPDIVTYNVLIKMCARAGRKHLIVSTLELAINAGLNPSMDTFTSLVAAYVGFSDLTTAERIIQAMRDGRTDLCQMLREHSMEDGKMSCSLLDEESNALLERIVGTEGALQGPAPLLRKTYQPNARVYTTLMKGYMQMGRLDDVVWTIRAMKQEPHPASRPDHVTYTTVITALVNAGSMEQAHEVFDEMTQANIPANLFTYNVLIKGYCTKFQLNMAKELMHDMESQNGVSPDVVTYNILINACLCLDDTPGALSYYNEMRGKGIAPSKVSYTTLMKAFAFSGQPKLAHKVFDEMVNDPRVKVDTAAWNMLVFAYCKMGLLADAKKVMEQMKEHGMVPDVVTYGTLADCIVAARKPGEALLLWKEVKERCEGSPPFKPDEGLLVSLADVCVRAGFFRRALEIVACMEDNGIIPNKSKYKKIYVQLHSRMFTSPHASQARKDRRRERARAAEAFKFWLGLPNSYYGTEWTLDPLGENDID